MNTEKLLRIINEVLSAEEQYSFQTDINSIPAFIQENNPDQINLVKERIFSNFEKTPMSVYVNTELKSLKEVSGFGYFDSTMKNNLDDILKSASYEIVQKLQEYITKRNTLIEQIRALQTSLNNLAVKSDEVEKDKYLVAFAFPEKYHNLDNLQKATKDIDQFLRSLTISLPDENKNYEITSVDNGCIEYFIHVLPELAMRVVRSLDTILMIKGAIDLCAQSKELFTRYIKKNRIAAGKIAEEQLAEEKRNLVDKFIKNLSIDGTDVDINDGENRIRTLMCVIVKYFEEGVAIEVKTPQIEVPREETEQDSPEIKEQLKEQKKIYENKLKIDEINKNIYLLQQEKVKLNLPEQSSLEDAENEQSDE